MCDMFLYAFLKLGIACSRRRRIIIRVWQRLWHVLRLQCEPAFFLPRSFRIRWFDRMAQRQPSFSALHQTGLNFRYSYKVLTFTPQNSAQHKDTRNLFVRSVVTPSWRVPCGDRKKRSRDTYTTDSHEYHYFPLVNGHKMSTRSRKFTCRRHGLKKANNRTSSDCTGTQARNKHVKPYSFKSGYRC
jgi:hypothetical protein